MNTIAIPAPPVAAPQVQAAPAVAPGSGPRRRIRKRYVVLVVLLLLFFVLPLAAAYGVWGFFRLSPATKDLRGSMMAAVQGQWDKKIAVNVGWFTFGTARLVSHFVNMPEEPRAALSSVHAADVGVYKLRGSPAVPNAAAIFATADKKMNSRGWMRMVGVVKDGDFVAVYCPRKINSARNVAFAVAVLHERDLVVASVCGNAEPLIKLARDHAAKIQDSISL